MDELVIEKAAERLIKHLPQEKNILKLVEECTELNEVLIKYLTKSEGLKPSMAKVIEEMGDVIFRANVVARMFNISEEVEKRIDEKAQILLNWTTEKFEN